MEDRFKFRAWDKKRGLMVGADYPDNWPKIKDEYYGDWMRIELDSIRMFAESGEYPLMQSTGLRDKNGVLIYEGDVVSFAINGYFNGAVERDKYGGWQVRLLESSRSSVYPEMNECRDFKNHDVFEIIGNIHEHPHLLN